MSKVEPIEKWEFHCTPSDRSCAIRSMTVYIYAKNKEDAQKILMSESHKFFDQSLNIISTKKYSGYRQVVNEEV